MMYVQYADGVINVINLSILHLFCSGIIDQNVCNMMVDLRVSGFSQYLVRASTQACYYKRRQGRESGKSSI